MKLVGLTIVLALLSLANGARILGIFHMPSGSHYILGSSLMRGLAEKGHDITMVTPYKSNKKVPNVREIHLEGVMELTKGFHDFLLDPKNNNIFTQMKFFIMSDVMNKIAEAPFLNPKFQELMKNEKFDLVIFEPMMTDFYFGLAHHFNAPSIVLSPAGNQMANHLNGNPSPPSFVPTLTSGFGSEMTFTERIKNTLSYFILQVFQVYKHCTVQEKLYRKYFENGPELKEIMKNVSLILVNGHVCLESPRPYLPNMIPIGGYHITEPKELPKDLKEFLDNAKDGAIYFSLGSHLESKDMPQETVKHILNTFKKFPQKILWKFENDTLEGKPDNVKISKWFPQSDILAHPNLRVFITHGGLLSSTEAVYRGVPLIGIPIFGDQTANSKTFVREGLGLMVDYSELNEEKLTEALNEILSNPKYSENIKKRSRIILDQPDKPLDRAVFWVEHVLRHGGDHLRSAVVDLNLAQYLLLDVIAFLIGITVIFVGIIYLSCKFLCCRKKWCCKKKSLKVKKH